MNKAIQKMLGAGCAAGLVAVGLVACGGGDGVQVTLDPLFPGTDVPTSATISSDGALAFIASVAAGSSDSSEPIVLGDTVLASSDTAEPTGL